jgi:hypothetical protein
LPLGQGLLIEHLPYDNYNFLPVLLLIFDYL